MIEIDKLFYSYIVKVWTGISFGSNKYRVVNVIAVWLCVQYYYKY